MKVYPVKPYFPPEDIERIKNDVGRILSSGMITTHSFTKTFENKFAELCGTTEAVAVNSGSAALELVLQCLDVKGTEVLVPTNTFTATVSPILRTGAKPILTDIDPKTLCIDIEAIQEKLTSKTRAIMVVHVGGLICPEMFQIKELCEDHHLYLIEDSAHAHGSKIDGKAAGSFGDAGCFSMYATKIITTAEGGVITTNNTEITQKIRTLRDQGKNPSNADEVIDLGYSYRYPEINAALGIAQLDRLDEIIRKRTEIAKFYNDKLDKMDGITAQRIPKNIVEGYYKHVAFLDEGIDRDLLKKKLWEKGVICGGEVYAIPIHMQPVYIDLLKTKKGDFPNAEYACSRMLCLPITAQMTQEQREYVIMELRDILESM